MNKSPLHIEIVTDTYVPDINGVAISLGRLAHGLRENGHRVTILRSGKSHSQEETAIFSWPLPGYWEINVGAPWPGQIKRRWKKQPPDIVYIAIETPLGFSAMNAARALRIPVIGGFHTNFKEYLLDYRMGPIAIPVGLYQKWFHGKLLKTIVPSPGMSHKLTAEGFTNVEILGRGVDTQLFTPEKRSDKLRKKWGADENTPIAIVVGRVSAEKNIQLAIRAFARMRKIEPKLIAIVIGNGPIWKKLARAHPEVHFPGYSVGQELAECYASADILLFPSETETFGNVTLEAMASGLPTLAYDYAAAAWHGTNTKDCLKVPKGHEEKYLEAAETLLDPTLRKTLSKNARETAKTLGWPAIVSHLETILHHAIQKNK